MYKICVAVNCHNTCILIHVCNYTFNVGFYFIFIFSDALDGFQELGDVDVVTGMTGRQIHHKARQDWKTGNRR